MDRGRSKNEAPLAKLMLQAEDRPMHDGACCGHSHGDEGSEPHWSWLLASALGCGVFALIGIYLDRQAETQNLARAAYAAAFLCGGWEAALDAYERLKSFRLDIHFLMLSVAIGAAAIGAWWEGAALLFLFSLSHALEAMAMARTEREIHSLFQDAPKVATVVEPDGSEHEVSVDSLAVGQVLHLLPGNQFPADARVTKGQSAADESSLTGESVAVEKEVGDTVYSGTLNTYGVLFAEVIRPSSESAHARIIRLIRDAQASKAPSQKFTDKFGTRYTTGLLGVTVVLFLMWYFGMGLPAFTAANESQSAFYRAMTFLVVCSPCALVISIPSAILSGIAAGARRGILFRGGIALENLAKVDRIAMDKTGTLTKGELELIEIEVSESGREEEILKLAAALSVQSTHPLSRAIVEAFKKRTVGETTPGERLVSLPGQGLRGEVNGNAVTLGRRALFPENSWLQALPDPAPGLSEVLVWSGEISGRLLLRDGIRPEAAALVRRMHQQGIKVTMLTGDRSESAELVAKELQLDDVRSGLKPEDKVAAIQEWRNAGEHVAMVGDGVNDAPSLAAADISIGMGLRGSDAVLEQADVILTKDKLERVQEALALSRRCRAVIRQNLAISLGVVVLLAISALGSWIKLPVGVLGHEGSTIIVVLNSLRLLLRSR